MLEDTVTQNLRDTFRDSALVFDPHRDLVSAAKAQAGRTRRRRVLVSCIGVACVVGVAVAALPWLGSGSARDSVIEAMSARGETAMESVWYHESLIDLLPNTKFQVGDAPARALSESVVVGRFVVVERGRAFFTAGDEDPRTSAEEFDDPRVQWRTVHANLEVEQTIAGKQRDRVTVGFSFVGRSPDFEEIDEGLRDFGRVVLFLSKSSVFRYDPDVLGTVQDGSLVGLIDEDGDISLPLAGDAAGRLLNGASSVDQLVEAAERPERVIRVGASGQRANAGDRVADMFEPAAEDPGPTWTRDGQPVRPSDPTGVEIAVSRGPSHCGWESTTWLSFGWPLGTRATDSRQARTYIRDPQGVISDELRAGFQRGPGFPADVRPTGYRTGYVELWLAPSDQDRYAYLVNAEDHSDAERWPLGGRGCS